MNMSKPIFKRIFGGVSDGGTPFVIVVALDLLVFLWIFYVLGILHIVGIGIFTYREDIIWIIKSFMHILFYYFPVEIEELMFFYLFNATIVSHIVTISVALVWVAEVFD